MSANVLAHHRYSRSTFTPCYVHISLSLCYRTYLRVVFAREASQRSHLSQEGLAHASLVGREDVALGESKGVATHALHLAATLIHI
jgi:hypothetical protein